VSLEARAAENAIDHGADDGNPVTGASTVAIAWAVAITLAVAGAGVVDRAAGVIAAVTAAADNDTTATSVASRSIAATGGAGHRASGHCRSGKAASAANMTTAWMAGSERACRHWHATQRHCGRQSDEGLFVKHANLLLCFKQKICL
jgi:hypothetical protein